MRSTIYVPLVSWLVVVAGISIPLQARELDLPDNPVFIGIASQPNLFVTLDDSGSMRAAWDKDGDESASVHIGDGQYRCAFQTPKFFWSGFNKLYYDPATQYDPPIGSNGEPLPDSDFFAAPIDGYRQALGHPVATVDLSTQYLPTFEYDHYWSAAGVDGHGRRKIAYSPTPAAPTAASSSLDACNSSRSAFNASYLQFELPFATVSATGAVTSAAFYYDRTGSIGIPMVFGPPLVPGVAPENNPANYTARAITDPVEQQNFANWFTYYHTRSLSARAALSTAFAPIDGEFRAAWQNLTNNWLTSATPVRVLSGSHRSAFYSWLYSLDPAGSTPLRAATLRVADKLRRSAPDDSSAWYDAASNAELACRSNFHALITDGYWNEWNPADTTGDGDNASIALPDGKSYAPGDTDSRAMWNEYPSTSLWCTDSASALAATCDPTLADIAFHNWRSDLRPDLADVVPPRWKDFSTGVTSSAPMPTDADAAQDTPEVYWNPANDPATWQHLVNFGIALGVNGTLGNPFDTVKYPNLMTELRTGVRRWPAPRNASTTGIDDLAHAAVNSRGRFFHATNSQSMLDAMRIILEVAADERGSASAPTPSGGVATGSTFAIEVGFDSSDWSGSVDARRIAVDGSLGDSVWPGEAGAQLTARDPQSRQVITSGSSTGGGIPFRWDNLDSFVQTALNDNPLTPEADNDALGPQRLSWLRGDASQEQRHGGPFANRRTVLGATVHGAAALVTAPSADYDDARFPAGSPEAAAAGGANGYGAFREAHHARRRVALVPANDGMLHAFDAGSGSSPGSGEELWAYVPYEVTSRLNDLTQPHDGFIATVDGTPVLKDVFLGGRWRTVAVGGLRTGGQGIYALDVTDPLITESSAGSAVLWEFSDNHPDVDASRLGYTIAEPNIARLPHGRWVVLLPGGVNNEASDARAGDGRAALFVIDLETGQLVREFILPSWGLSFATTASRGGDYVDDMAVAGDIEGNVWMFDFTSASPAAWTFEQVYAPAVAEQHPITSGIRILPATGADMMLVFGTGKLLEASDRSPSVEPQRLIGLRVPGPGGSAYPLTENDLLPRSVTATVHGGATYYQISDAPLPDDAHGWYVELPRGGVINTPHALLSQGLVLFESVAAAGSDPCVGGLHGAYFVLDAQTGTGPDTPTYFDSDGDGDIDTDDLAAAGRTVADVRYEGSPSLLTPIGGGVASVVGHPEVSVPVPVWRRRMWREL